MDPEEGSDPSQGAGKPSPAASRAFFRQVASRLGIGWGYLDGWAYPNAMLPYPRSTSRIPRWVSRSGLSSRVTILALAGGGAALFLFVILPQLMTSQAAEQRRFLPGETAQEEDGATAAKDELVPAAVLPPDENASASTTLVETAAATAPVAPAGAAELVASNETPEAPKLKHVKGEGGRKANLTTHKDLHASQRQKRQEQRAAGIDPAQQAQAARAKAKEDLAESNPNRERIQQPSKRPPGQSPSGRSRGRRDPKKKQKDEPTDG